MRNSRFALLLALITGCSSSPENQTMEELFEGSVEDLSSAGGFGGMSDDVQGRQAERVDAARRAWLQQKLASAEDHLWCAAVLANSKDLEDLVLAYKLALEADRLGDRRGQTLSAEIIDKELLERGEPQRYGTQIVFDRFTRRYRMYDLDPATTDAERRAVGLPSLEELMARVGLAEREQGDPVRNGRRLLVDDPFSEH